MLEEHKKIPIVIGNQARQIQTHPKMRFATCEASWVMTPPIYLKSTHTLAPSRMLGRFQSGLARRSLGSKKTGGLQDLSGVALGRVLT